eukprot:Platyproteum_vivax@DN2946_c0_g1_i1.p1
MKFSVAERGWLMEVIAARVLDSNRMRNGGWLEIQEAFCSLFGRVVSIANLGKFKRMQSSFSVVVHPSVEVLPPLPVSQNSDHSNNWGFTEQDWASLEDQSFKQWVESDFRSVKHIPKGQIGLWRLAISKVDKMLLNSIPNSLGRKRAERLFLLLPKLLLCVMPRGGYQNRGREGGTFFLKAFLGILYS